MSEKEGFLDTEKRWRSFCRTKGASAAQSSARGLNDHARSASIRVYPRPKAHSPGCFMNYPG
jgi:hypothetical protein